VAALAYNDKEAIEECISTHGELNQWGVYSARFFIHGWQDGVWQARPLWLLIDDYFPVSNSTEACEWIKDDSPIFCKPGDEGALWAVYLEKAFAKWAGSYGNLDGLGRCLLGPWPHSSHGFPLIKQMGFSLIKDAKFHMLAELNSENPMMASPDLVDGLLATGAVVTTHGKEGECEMVHSVLAILHVKAYSMTGTVDLVKLRSLFGTLGAERWSGDWCDNSQGSSELWRQNPHVAEEVGLQTDVDDGVFFMTWKDFCITYERVSIIGPDDDIMRILVEARKPKECILGVCRGSCTCT